jgi:hypothetical protein
VPTRFIVAVMLPRQGASRACDETPTAARSRGPKGRAIAPGRGRLRPRAAQAHDCHGNRIADQQRLVSGTQHSRSN